MITDFYLFESKGVPDDILNFIENIISNDIILNNDITKQYTINTKNITSTIILNIKYIKNSNEKYKGDIEFLNAIKNNFNNVKININVESITPIKNNILSTILHELTHLYELYQIKDFFIDTKWNRSKSLIDSKKQDKINIFRYYRDLYYLTLPQEVNARVASVYYKLYQSDKKMILGELKMTKEWCNLNNIKDFKPNEYSKNIISILGLDFTIYLINEFNNIMNIKTKVDSEIDIYNYFKKYKRYSISVYKNYKNKLLKIVDKLNENIEHLCCSDKNVIYENYIDKNVDIHINDYM